MSGKIDTPVVTAQSDPASRGGVGLDAAVALGRAAVWISALYLAARLLTPAGLGQAAIAAALVIGVVSLLRWFVPDRAGFQKLVSGKDLAEATGGALFFAIVAGSALTGMALLLIDAEAGSKSIGLDAQLWWMSLFAIVPLLLLKTCQNAITEADGRIEFTLLFRDLAALVGYLILTLYSQISVHTFSAVLIVATLLSALLMLTHLVRSLDEPLSPSLKALVRSFGEEIEVRSAAMLARVKSAAELLLPAFYLRIDEIGIYAVAMILAGGFTATFGTLGTGSAHDSNSAQLNSSHRRASQIRAPVAIGLASATALCLLSPFLLTMALGSAYRGVSLMLLFLLPASVILVPMRGRAAELDRLGARRHSLIINAASLAAFLAAGALLIPKLGLLGAVITSGVTRLFAGLMLLNSYLQETGLSLPEALILQRGDLRRLFAGPDEK